jgi:hypothetical protein
MVCSLNTGGTVFFAFKRINHGLIDESSTATIDNEVYFCCTILKFKEDRNTSFTTPSSSVTGGATATPGPQFLLLLQFQTVKLNQL